MNKFNYLNQIENADHPENNQTDDSEELILATKQNILCLVILSSA